MAEFSPNLDDGELWLPSDIFPDESSSKFDSDHRPDFDELVQRFTTFTLLQSNKPTQNLPPKSEWFKPAARFDQFAASSNGFFTVNGSFDSAASSNGLFTVNGSFDSAASSNGFFIVNGSFNDSGHRNLIPYDQTNSFSVSPRPFYQYHSLEPAQPQLQRRARVLQRQQNLYQNQGVLPIQGSRMGGFVRETGGTGVFIPRIAATAAATATTTSNEVRKKQGVRNRHHAQMIKQTNSINRIAMGKHEDCHCQLSSKMGLPQDWTY